MDTSSTGPNKFLTSTNGQSHTQVVQESAASQKQQLWAMIAQKARRMLQREAREVRSEQERERRCVARHHELMREQVERKREKVAAAQRRWSARKSRSYAPSGWYSLSRSRPPRVAKERRQPIYRHESSRAPDRVPETRVGPYTHVCLWACHVFWWVGMMADFEMSWFDGSTMEYMVFIELYYRLVVLHQDALTAGHFYLEVGLRDMMVAHVTFVGRCTVVVLDLRSQAGQTWLEAWNFRNSLHRESGALWATEKCRHQIRRNFWAWQTFIDRHILIRASIFMWFDPFYRINFANGLEVLCFNRILAHNLALMERRRAARARRRRLLRVGGYPVPSPSSSHSSSAPSSPSGSESVHMSVDAVRANGDDILRFDPLFNGSDYRNEASTDPLDQYQSNLPATPVDETIDHPDSGEGSAALQKITCEGGSDDHSLLVEFLEWWHFAGAARIWLGFEAFVGGGVKVFAPALFQTGRRLSILDTAGEDLIRGLQWVSSSLGGGLAGDFLVSLSMLEFVILCPLPFGHYNFHFVVLVFCPFFEEVLKRVSPTCRTIFILTESTLYGDDWISAVHRSLCHEYYASLPFSTGVFNHVLWNATCLALDLCGIDGYVVFAVTKGVTLAIQLMAWSPTLVSWWSYASTFSPRLAFSAAVVTRLFDVYVGYDSAVDILTYLIDKIRGKGSELQLGSSLARNPKSRLWQQALLGAINDLANRAVGPPVFREEGFKEDLADRVKGVARSGLSGLEAVLGYLSGVREAGVYSAFMTLFATICAVPLIFETESDPDSAVNGFRKTFEASLPLAHGNIALNFLSAFKTALQFLVKSILGEDALPLDETTAFLTEVSWLKVHLVRVSNHRVDGAVPVQEFSARLSAARAKSSGLMKRKGSPGAQSLIVRALGDLTALQADFDAQFGGLTKRERAIAIVICGHSGTGKSQLVDAFAYKYLRWKGLIPDKYVVPKGKHPLDEFRGPYIAKRTPLEAFDSTITNATAVYVEEECNRYNATLYKTTPQEHYIPRLLSLVDEQPTPVLKAEISEKGRVINRAGLSIFVTNSPFEGMTQASNAASAYPALTRPLFVHMEVDSVYQKPNMQIDPDKVREHVERDGGRYTDSVRYSVGRVAFKGDPVEAVRPKSKQEGAKYLEEPRCLTWEDGLCYSDLMARFDQILQDQDKTSETSAAAAMDYLGVCRDCRHVVCECEVRLESWSNFWSTWSLFPDVYRAWFRMWKLYCQYQYEVLSYLTSSVLRAHVANGSYSARFLLWLRPDPPHWSETWGAYSQAECEYELHQLKREHQKIPMSKEKFENKALRIRVKFLERELQNQPKAWRYHMAIGFVSGLITAVTAYKLFSLFCSQTFREEGTSISIPAKRSTADTIEELEKRVDAGPPTFPPPRRRPEFPLPTFEKFELNGRADQFQPLDVIHRRIQDATYACSVYEIDAGGSRRQILGRAHAVQVLPGVFVANYHMFVTRQQQVKVYLSRLDQKVLSETCASIVVISDCKRDGDVIYFTAQCLAKRQDLSGLFREEKLVMSPSSLKRKGFFVGVTTEPVEIQQTFVRLMEDGMPADMILYSGRKSEEGDCARVLLLELEKGGKKLYQVVGIHGGSYQPEGHSCAAVVSRQTLDLFVNRCITKLHFRPQSLCGPVPIDNDMIPLSHKNELAMHLGAHGMYHGSFDVPISRIPMSARSSVMAPYVPVLFPGVDPSEFTAPISKRGLYVFADERGDLRKGYFDPFGTYCNGALVNPGLVAPLSVDPRIARFSIDNYLQRIEMMVDFSKYSVKPLTHKEAICGVRDFVRSMNLKTSAGPGFDGIKSKYIKKGVDVTVDESVVESVMSFADAASQGYFVPLIAKACPKDEVREYKWQKPLDSDENLLAPKPARMFFVSPLPDLIHAKMFVGPLMALAEAEPEAFEHIIGINSHSIEWNELHDFFKWKGRMFDSDVSGWDKAILYHLLLGLREVIMYLAIRVGYNKEAQTQLWARLCAESNPFVLLQESLVMLENITPSGRVDTTMINSIMMSLFYRIVYYTVFWQDSGKSVDEALAVAPDFNDDVQLKSNGDDAITSVSDQCTFFNQRTMVETGNKLGVACTNGAKTSETTDFRDISEITMLKRHFRLDSEVGKILAPLPYKSLAKSLSMFTESSIPDKDRDIAAISSVVLEMFHHGRGEFDRVCGQLKTMMVELGWEDEISKAHFKTFDQLCADRFGPQ